MYLTGLLTAIYIVLANDPRDFLKPASELSDPYAPWVIVVARIKRFMCPWYWNQK